jgi:hypothetical protein
MRMAFSSWLLLAVPFQVNRSVIVRVSALSVNVSVVPLWLMAVLTVLPLEELSVASASVPLTTLSR